MTHRGRHAADDPLAAALAAGRTVRAAAAAAGVSEKTAHRRNADPAFRARVAALRAGMIGAAAGRLADGMAAAADALRELLADPDPNVRYKAAAKLVELGLRVREHAELTDRVVELEEQMGLTSDARPRGPLSRRRAGGASGVRIFFRVRSCAGSHGRRLGGDD